MLERKNTVTEMKNAFQGLISRLDIAKERISEPEDISIETSKSKEQREQRLIKRKMEGISKEYETIVKVVTYV